MNRVRGWIEELCRVEGLPPPEIDGFGDWDFMWGELPCLVSADERDEVVVFVAGIAAAPSDPAKLHAELLRRNLSPRELGGAAFALDEGLGRIALVWSGAVAGLDAIGFRNALLNFLETAQRCAEELGAPPAPARREAPAGDLAMQGFLRI